MLSSIHPLGERARSNRWWLTVTAFAIGAVAAGMALGLVASSLGAGLGGSWNRTAVVIGVVALAAVADLFGVAVPTPARQVNERWIGTYRGWVYGAGFGIQLGAGFATYVVSWAVPALAIALAVIGDPTVGMLAGGVFGLGRTAPLLAAGWIDRADRLAPFHRMVAELAKPVRIGGSLLMLAVLAVPGAIA